MIPPLPALGAVALCALLPGSAAPSGHSSANAVQTGGQQAAVVPGDVYRVGQPGVTEPSVLR